MQQSMGSQRVGHDLATEQQHFTKKKNQKTTHGHHQMVNTEVRLIIFFAAKDGEVLHSKNKTES